MNRTVPRLQDQKAQDDALVQDLAGAFILPSEGIEQFLQSAILPNLQLRPRQVNKTLVADF